jgi:hypothetical protein
LVPFGVLGKVLTNFGLESYKNHLKIKKNNIVIGRFELTTFQARISMLKFLVLAKQIQKLG